MSITSTIRVLLVDDHALVRGGIRRLLDDYERIVVVGEAETGEEALEQVETLRPDVILMDVTMPGMGGVEATRRILKRHAEARVVVLTAHSEGAFPKRLLKAGASGYVTKDSSIDEMVRAIRQVHGGEYYISPHIAQKLALAMIPGRGDADVDRLSRREFQVLQLITQGHGNQVISDRLCLSPKTVSTYRSRLLEKLNAQTEAELVRIAIDSGIIEIGKIEETEPPSYAEAMALPGDPMS